MLFGVKNIPKLKIQHRCNPVEAVFQPYNRVSTEFLALLVHTNCFYPKRLHLGHFAEFFQPFKAVFQHRCHPWVKSQYRNNLSKIQLFPENSSATVHLAGRTNFWSGY